ncbi:putative 57 kDa heat shock protein isoform X2 [Brassica napus]|uniref:putative 57 kDa heat shock protein isoform X2 n=1 Tax=Brassica napus TaxID=3708 RepID=UPI00207AD470|nr:putative 57 kDa heat shock protein isoform X2 [Brassica napus]
MVVSLPPQSQTSSLFYGVNNPYLKNGPKGFKEYKILKNGDTYLRIDLPGVPMKAAVEVSLWADDKGVEALVDAPKQHKHDSSQRTYCPIIGFMCGRCKVLRFTSQVCDGVLRLVLTPTARILGGRFLGGADWEETYPSLTGPVLEPNPSVNEGSPMAYESKRLPNGSLYVRVDMPGVPKDRFTVSVADGRVTVTGEAPAVSHDSDGRFYSGDVALLDTLVTFRRRWIKTIVKDGVISFMWITNAICINDNGKDWVPKNRSN